MTKDGYEATWTIPHLARALPQAGREDKQMMAWRRTAFGLRFVEANDFYQKAFRAGRYGILFIAPMFLTVVLMERGSGQPVHPVQYILIGLVQTVFVLLMVACAEHLGWGPAYLITSGATIALLTAYGLFGLKLGRRALVLGRCWCRSKRCSTCSCNRRIARCWGGHPGLPGAGADHGGTQNEDWFGPERPRLLGGSEPPAPPPDIPA